MSYNITNWKTKQIKDLVLNKIDLQYSPEMIKKGYEVSFNITKEMDDSKLVHINIGSESDTEIVGYLQNDDTILVESISLSGECSGTAYNYILLPALKNSSGKLLARIIWEGWNDIVFLDVSSGNIDEIVLYDI